MKLELITKDGGVVGYCLLTESEEEKQAVSVLVGMHRHGENESIFSMEFVRGKATDESKRGDSGNPPADTMKFIQYRHIFTPEEELKVESVRTRSFGHIICAKCGGTHVTCDAKIYPNTGELDTILPDICTCGWCEDCKEDVVLCEISSLHHDLDSMFELYIKKFGCEPQYALCDIFYKEDECREEVVIKLSQDYVEGQDDKVFVSCNGIHAIKQMVDPTAADYVVLACHRLYRIENNEEI